MGRQVAVVAREDPSGGKRLVGYVVPAVTGEADVRKLAGFAREHLPDYLVPSVFVAIDRLPLTPSGKLDRRALPSPSGPDAESGPGFVAPRTRAGKGDGSGMGRIPRRSPSRDPRQLLRPGGQLLPGAPGHIAPAGPVQD